MSSFNFNGSFTVVNGQFNDSEPNRQIDEIKSADFKNIESLIIVSNVANVNVYADSSVERLEAHLHGMASKDVKLHMETDGSTLRIEENSAVNFCIKELKLDIKVPKKNLKSINLNSISGDLMIVDLSCDDINVMSTSGNLEVAGYFSDMYINTISGDISMYVNAKGYFVGRIFSLSGDITLQLINVAFIVFHAKSLNGDVRNHRQSIDRNGYNARLDVLAGNGDITIS